MFRSAIVCLASAALLFILAAGLPAQVNLATVVGTVKDTSGAVVPNAKVTVKNQGTGIERTTSTSASGDYTITNLPVGHYSLTVTMPGFKKTSNPNVVLQVGQTARMDAVLEVGVTTQQVTVTTSTPLISTTTSDVGQVVTRKVLNNIPLNGRSFWQLTQLTPGATYTPGGENPYTSSSAIRATAVNVSINGGPTDQTGWTLDGSSILENNNGGTDIQPNVDALQEFKVESGNMSAQYGRTPTVVTAVIKSGTNQFHGDLWEFLRNDAFDARNFFFVTPKGSKQTKDILKRNQFGGTLGGPIKRNKAFFFADFEETLVRQDLVFDNIVPSPAMRQGDFSALLPKTQLLNPYNNYQPFPNNTIPSTMFSPQGQFFLKYMPQPNFAVGNTDYAVFGNRLALNTAKGDLKMDENITSRDHLMGRYSINNDTEANPNAFPALGILDDHSRGQDFTMAYTHIFNAHWLNVAQFGYYRMLFLFGAPLPGTFFGLPDQANYLGFDDQLYGGFPQINISGYSGFTGAPSNQEPKRDHIRTWEYQDTLSHNSGNHDMKMGFQLYHNTDTYITGSSTQGTFNFLPEYTGNAFSDFLLGLPDSVTRDPGAPAWSTYGNWPALFFQDNYRATQNLTLNLGLRWEYNPFFSGEYGQISGINLTSGKLIIPSNFDVNARPLSAQLLPLYKDRIVYTNSLGLPLSVVDADKTDFAPRVGFAWKPFGKNRWAIRTGYGIFYAYPDNTGPDNTVSVPPDTVTDTEFNNTAPALPTRTWANFFLGAPLAGVPNPNPGQPCPLGFVAISCSTPSLDTGEFGHQTLTYIQEWNFTVQHEITSALSLNVAYVGNNTHHLLQNIGVNNPAPGAGEIQPRRPLIQWGTISEYQYGGLANYNALQVSVNSRTWHGLSLLGNYTYSKCMDNNGAPTESLIGASYAVCDLNRTQSSAASYDYQLPFGQGQHFLSSMHGVANQVLGGWIVSGVLTLQSGLPFTPTITKDQANTGVGGQRPDIIAAPIQTNNVSCWYFTSSNSSCTALFPNDQDWWSLPPKEARYGTGGRNVLRADPLKEWDFALLKNFKVTESKTLQFRAEFFNLLNTPTFSTPSGSVNAASGGVVTSTLNAARQIQLALKFYF
ncbi:MAG: carboxypeptidase regulatory-like domain-containing protein [Terriglobia bacterium]